MKAITYNKENECQKQEGVAPNMIIYSGRIDAISYENLSNWGIGYNDLADILKDANGESDEDSVLLLIDEDIPLQQ
jgi:hypothetical protein